MKRFRLLHRFVLLMVLLSVGPLLLVGVRFFYLNQKASRELISLGSGALETTLLEYQTSIAVNFSDKISAYFGNVLQSLSVIISQQFADLTQARKHSVLSTLYATARDLVALGLVQENAFVLKIPRDHQFPAEKIAEILRRARKEKVLKISDVYFEKEEPRLALAYALSGKEGIVFIATLKELWARIENQRFGTPRTGYVFLVDRQGHVIAHPDRKKALTAESASGLEIIQALLQGGSVGSKEFKDEKDVPMVGSYAPIEMTGWGVVAVQPKADAYSTLIRMRQDSRIYTGSLRRQTVFLVIIFLIISSIVAFYLARSLSGPILEIISGARRVAGRDFDSPVLVKTGDELQDLADTFNTMMAELKRYDTIQADKLDAIVYSIDDGVVFMDHDLKFVLANQKARDILKIKGDPGRLFLDTIGELQALAPMRELADMLKKRQEERSEVELDLSYGEIKRFFSARFQRVRSREKQEIGYVVVVRDITLQKEIEKMREEFLHSITHDLRSPLTSIRGFLEVLLDGSAGELTDQQKNFLAIMDRSSEKLLRLINDLLDTAKMEAGRFSIHLNEFAMDEVTRQITEILQATARKEGLVINLEKKGEDFRIKADQQLVERVLTNLVGNALKFTPSGGKIFIRLEENASQLRMEVEDTGEGIPPEYLDKIFDKFQQAGRKKGTGLGLTICKHIIEAHKGKITVESKMGEGTRFRFFLPRNPEI